MEKYFELVGIEIPESWSPSDCSSHVKIKALLEVEEGKVIAVVRHDKLKLFGKDENGIIRYKSWPLSSAENAEGQASLILQKKFSIILPPAHQKMIVFPQPNPVDVNQRVMA